MGLVIRQSIISSTLSYVGVAIAYFNLLWLFPKVLQPDEIGLIRIIQEIAIVLVPFAQIGLSQSTIKFFPVFKEDHQKSGSYLTFIIISTFGTYFFFSAHLFAVKKSYQ
jgi:O-antigen/teichoic acid export membrane protein